MKIRFRWQFFSMHPLTTGQCIGLVMLIALTFRLFYFQQAISYPLLFIPQLDEKYYLDWARKLLEKTDTVSPSILFMDPLYAWVLAILLELFGEAALPVRVLQILVDSGTAALLVTIGARLWNLPSGLLAGLFYAVYPPACFYSLALLKTSFTTALLTLIVWQLIAALQHSIVRRWLFLGALAGAAVFLRANLLLSIPLIAVVMLTVNGWRKPMPLSIFTAFALGVGFLLVVCGLFNQTFNGRFTILPATGGTTFYSVHNPDNPGGGYLTPGFIKTNNPGLLAQQYQTEAERREGRQMTDQEVSDYWRDQAITYLLSSADIVPRLLLKKLAQLFGYTEQPNNHSMYIAAEYIPMLVPTIPAFALALGLGVPGLILGLRRNRFSMPILIPIGVVLITSMLYYSSARFRLPMVPMLLLGAGLLLERMWRKGWPKRIRLLLIVALIAAVSLAIPPLPSGNDQAYMNLALAHAQMGEAQKADEMLSRTSLGIRGTDIYQHVAGDLAVWADDYEKAWSHYRELALQQTEDKALLHNGALAALRSGQPEQALPLFQRLMQLTGEAEYHYWLGKTLLALDRLEAARRELSLAAEFAETGSKYLPDLRAALRRLKDRDESPPKSRPGDDVLL